jgi:hypothetical protein
MKKTVIFLFALLCTGAVWGQEKKVAMLEPVVKGGSVTQIEKEIILATLEEAITEFPGYKAFTRVDVNQITKELSFQQNGMVDDAQRKKIGIMSGASLICVSQLTAGTNILIIKCSLVDVETGEIVNTANQLMKKDENDIYEGCRKLAGKLIGKEEGGSTSGISNSSSSGSPTNGAAYNPDGIELVYVEGTGSTKGFYIGKYEVTQTQWQAIMGNNPSAKQDPLHPVTNVSWNDAKQFLSKLSEKTGRSYRLPTEGEWVYAANGGSNGDTYEYAGSNNIDEVAWYDGNSGWYEGSTASHTHKVGTKKPNSIGIYDMSGNVWEWCSDCYDSSCSYRVFRGGGWYDFASGCRVSDRYGYSPGDSIDILGFRLVVP